LIDELLDSFHGNIRFPGPLYYEHIGVTVFNPLCHLEVVGVDWVCQREDITNIGTAMRN
jgi:hypothetical protein